MLYTILSAIFTVVVLCTLGMGGVLAVAIYTKPDEKLLDSCMKSHLQKSTNDGNIFRSIVKRGASIAINKVKSVVIIDYIVFKTAEITVPGLSDPMQAVGAFNNWYILEG